MRGYLLERVILTEIMALLIKSALSVFEECPAKRGVIKQEFHCTSAQ